MKIEKLNEDKIKITLNMDDLEERNIDFHSFVYNSPESQDLFWDMIQEAERQYGFEFDESTIYVEASSSGSGTFTLIVTRAPDTKTIAPTNFKTKIRNGAYKLKRKNVSLKVNNIYLFDSFDDICDFCKSIDISKIESNTLYKMNDYYYLKINYMPFNSILEYANLLKSPELIEARIAEYGNVVIEENALQIIEKHFLKTKTKRRVQKKTV